MRPAFTWVLKDMQIARQMSDQCGLSLPLTGSIEKMVKQQALQTRDTNPLQRTHSRNEDARLSAKS